MWNYFWVWSFLDWKKARKCIFGICGWKTTTPRMHLLPLQAILVILAWELLFHISGFFENVPWIGEAAFQRVFEASVQHRRKEDSRNDRRGIRTIVDFLNFDPFLLCNLKTILSFDDVLYYASFCNDTPLYLQWYVPLVKPSSLQKTSWLDLF